ncbi:MAG: DUF4743 domain-containing protein [Chromatiaceae bacterium]|nr:DUF4743 domain-containing protein [Chromatiaceae bacterium]
MSLLDKIQACNAWNPEDFIPWMFAGRRIGSLRRDSLEALGRWSSVFERREDALHWVKAPASFTARSALLAEVTDDLIEQGVIPYRHGEPYPVTPGARHEAICVLDRASAPFFGIRAFGQHLNGYVRTERGVEMWIGRRSLDRRVYPGRLDHLVAGGLPHGVELAENLRKECREEAGMEPALADQARAVSLVTYCRASERGLKPDLIYCYDLELPPDFEPRCTDGEVESFQRLAVDEVLRLVRDTNDFKLNCNLVIIDFLARQGYLAPDDPDYLAILGGLRAPLP